MTNPYDRLAAEAALPIYEGMTGAEKAAAINAATVSVWRDLEASWLEGYLRIRGRFQAVKRFAAAPPPDIPTSFSDAMQDLVDIMEGRSSIAVFAMSDPNKRVPLMTLLGGMQSLHLLEREDVEAITARVREDVSVLSQIGLNQVQEGDMSS